MDAVRLQITGHADGCALRFVGPGSDETVAAFRTFDEAADAYRAAKDALGMLVACLATQSAKEA